MKVENWLEVFDREDTICHYTAFDAGIDILSTGKIRLSPFFNANDPLEFLEKPFMAAQGGNDIYLPPHSSAALFHINNEIKTNVRYVSFCSNINSMVLDSTINSERTDKCRYKSYGKPRMWAQYGRNHSGLCLVFSKRKLEELIPKSIHKGQIVYYESQITDYPRIDLRESYRNLLEYSKEFITQNMKSIFFKKSVDFVDENEFRIVTYSDSSEDIFLPIEDILIGVIRGKRVSISEINVQTFKKECEANNTFPYYLHWQDDKFIPEIEMDILIQSGMKWPYKSASITRSL
jgi:hypothetical protein